MQESRGSYRVLVGNPEGTDHFANLERSRKIILNGFYRI
jgi:hypothetical protein